MTYYRLIEKHEYIRTGDVAGYRAKQPINMELWAGCTADEFNQPVFRPLAEFIDLIPESKKIDIDLEKICK